MPGSLRHWVMTFLTSQPLLGYPGKAGVAWDHKEEPCRVLGFWAALASCVFSASPADGGLCSESELPALAARPFWTKPLPTEKSDGSGRESPSWPMTGWPHLPRVTCPEQVLRTVSDLRI